MTVAFSPEFAALLRPVVLGVALVLLAFCYELLKVGIDEIVEHKDQRNRESFFALGLCAGGCYVLFLLAVGVAVSILKAGGALR